MQNYSISLENVAEMVAGELLGEGDVVITNLASLESAGPGELTFLVKSSDVSILDESKAAAALVPMEVDSVQHIPVIRVKDPYLASALVHNHVLARPFEAAGIHQQAFVGNNCTISANITIGPMVTIGNRVTIGDRVTIEPGCVLGNDVVIGDDVTLKANVTIYEKCILANRITIHSGTVIGSDGYGYATDAMGNHVKRPQVGCVRIDDDVEIGANVCVDRGAFGDTWIQSGAKIDNQTQIAHNVVIGPNSLIVAQVGIAGSTVLGRNVVIGGKAGINGHIHLDDQVMVAAHSGVHGSLPKGAKVGGAPAFDVRKWARATAVFAKLPDMYSELRKLKKIVAALQESMKKTQDTGE